MSIPPMLAQAASVLPGGRGWRVEPKYDGMRILALVTAESIRLFSRGGNDKARQFPEVVAALTTLRQAVGYDFVIDCELVAYAGDGYEGFQALSSRIHLEQSFRIRVASQRQPAALVAFDLLLQKSMPLVERPLSERRKLLSAMLAGRTNATIRLARHGRNPDRMLAYAVRRNLEGVVAKREDSPYVADQRTALWLKYKLTRRQEFVVAGYTESSRRDHFGALVLGYYEGRTLVYAGSVGAGFSRRSLAECHSRLAGLAPAFCPFQELPQTSDPVCWLRPEAVVEVTFEQWTRDGKIRNPRFEGMRTDKDARDVVRERTA
ncbi:MAG TPA: non-homologous end-joining DNA ligase [Longimicrobium sp.]|nr:non-homologous end-joining DNA ligase [Longimicrobium sp.]